MKRKEDIIIKDEFKINFDTRSINNGERDLAQSLDYINRVNSKSKDVVNIFIPKSQLIYLIFIGNFFFIYKNYKTKNPIYLSAAIMFTSLSYMTGVFLKL